MKKVKLDKHVANIKKSYFLRANRDFMEHLNSDTFNGKTDYVNVYTTFKTSAV